MQDQAQHRDVKPPAEDTFPKDSVPQVAHDLFVVVGRQRAIDGHFGHRMAPDAAVLYKPPTFTLHPLV